MTYISRQVKSVNILCKLVIGFICGVHLCSSSASSCFGFFMFKLFSCSCPSVMGTTAEVKHETNGVMYYVKSVPVERHEDGIIFDFDPRGKTVIHRDRYYFVFV